MSDCYSDPYQNDYKAWLLGGIFLLVIFWHFSASAAICLQGKFKRLGIWQLSRWLLITELFTKTTPTIISVLIPSDLLITISSNTKSPKKNIENPPTHPLPSIPRSTTSEKSLRLRKPRRSDRRRFQKFNAYIIDYAMSDFSRRGIRWRRLYVP